jgi:pimeloyl-ACP methyl ester carboxylesterase
VFRTFTYWQMKKRAGVVGQTGVRTVVAALQGRFPSARVHLIGHSFGCKVMLAAVAGPGTPPPRPVETIVLLQGAVSSEAMAAKVTGTDSQGGYRAAVDPARASGPIVATYSRLDQACGRAYPVGSRLAGQVGELEGLFDRFRSLGAVGASGVGRGLEHRLTMKDVGTAYGFGPHGVWSVDGGTPPAAFITDHSAVRTPQVAWLIWSAMQRR